MKSLCFRSVWAEHFFLFLLMRTISAVFGLCLTMLAVHKASSWGWGDKDPPSDLYSIVLPEVGTLS